MSVHETARRTIQRHGLIPSGVRVCVALSGGADSVALFLVLRALAPDFDFHLAGAAHLNHLLRGVDSDKDEEFCRNFAADHGVRFESERVDVAERARTSGMSLEQAAHDARYEFFERAAQRLGADIVAVAHTRDDQAETFLLRLLRGAGPRGLAGMYPRIGRIVRPFIETSRKDIREFLAQGGIPFRDDASNADAAIPRNRVRHELIPLLAQRFSPSIVDVLDREATIARDDADFLDKASRAAAARLLHIEEGRIEVSIPALLAEHPAVGRRVLRGAQSHVSGGKFVGFDAVDAVLALAVSNSTGPIDLVGHRVNRVGETLVLTQRRGRGEADLGRAGAALFSYALPVPGQVDVPEAACAISAELRDMALAPGASHDSLANRGDEVEVEASQLSGPLEVRNRRPGDRFRPLGLDGHKKVQDLFVDAKIERARRDSIPLVVDAKDRIVWVAGVSVAEDFRVTDRTRAVVILRRVPS